MPATDEPASKATVLIAEDEQGVRDSLVEVLREEGYAVTAVSDGAAALKALDDGSFDLVLSDIQMPGATGLELLDRVRQIAPQTLMLLMTAHATVETAVGALRRGAHDYLLKPILFDDLLHKIEQLLEHRQIAWEHQLLRTEYQWAADKVIGQSAAMRTVMNLVERVGPMPSTVLITGESGAGKEVIARAIHQSSECRDRIFLPVNCGAIPEALLESQLFGHVRGAFTGAATNQEGLFQRARGGTIFLDEIGDLPIGLQVKLLRAIESKEILPVGASNPAKVEVRIIAATNRNLESEIEAGRFREDLYYRLNVVNIEIPPLRERREDIPPLIDHFVRHLNRALKKNFKGVDNQTMKVLMSWPWKGNVRELANVIEHAMILGDGEWIGSKDLPRPMQQTPGTVTPVDDNLREAMHAYERSHIEQVLAKCDFDKKAAADRLGVSLSSLYRKLEELG